VAKVTLKMPDSSPEAILQHLEAIIHELETLRQAILAAQVKPDSDNLAQKLFGVLGQGTWAEYDLDLDWHRFEA
jgi:hypothetical protein